MILCGPPMVRNPLAGTAKRNEEHMSGPLADVYANRVAAALQRAVAFNHAGDTENTLKALEEARDWLNKLREVMS